MQVVLSPRSKDRGGKSGQHRATRRLKKRVSVTKYRITESATETR
jgi:hypothetical protein